MIGRFLFGLVRCLHRASLLPGRRRGCCHGGDAPTIWLCGLVWLWGIVWIVFLPTAARAQVLINEILASNRTTNVDSDGDSSDWIELYNTGDIAVDLRDWALTDDPMDASKWRFPGVVIEPRQLLLVWCSGKDRIVPSAAAVTAQGSTVPSDPRYISLEAEWSFLSGNPDLEGPEEFIFVHGSADGRGLRFEREAYLEVIGASGERATGTGFGLRLHGGAGRGGSLSIKKSYKAYLRRVYGAGRLDYPMIPDTPVTSFDRLVLRGKSTMDFARVRRRRSPGIRSSATCTRTWATWSRTAAGPISSSTAGIEASTMSSSVWTTPSSRPMSPTSARIGT